ncbi:MAG: tetratricopeptide repeat protein [Candidatus Aminicenantes bacterium]
MSGAVALQQTAGELFEKALYVEEGQGDLQKAIGLYQDIVKKFPGEREIAAKSQLHIGLCYEKLGLKEAEKAFQKVVSDFPDQKGAVDLARERLSLLLRARAALEKSAGETRVRKVWDEAIDTFFTGAPSPDGRYLTYVDWENYANLGVRDLSAGNNRILTNNASWESGEMAYQSVFSPDGSRIAFSWQMTNGPVQMRTVNLDGSGLRTLNDGKNLRFQAPASWSSDGKSLVVVQVAPDQKLAIALMSVEDGSVQPVKSLAPRSTSPSSIKAFLSPDGRSIVYNYPPMPDSPSSDIFLVSAEGSLHLPLVEHPADDSVLGWSPDGTRIVFKSNRSGSAGLWSIEVAAGRPRGDPQMLRSDVGDISAMGLTRDGSLLFGQKSGWSDTFVAEMDPDSGNIVSEPVMIIRQNEGSNSAPDWSPDGQALACRTQEGLLVHDLRTNQTRKLATKGVGSLNFHYLRWSPDGLRIHGVGVDEKGKWGALYAIDARTGESKIIARSDEGGFLFAFDWAPDGKSLYFVRRDEIGRRRRIVRHDTASGAEEEIYGLRDSAIYGLAISPDGSQIAFATDGEVRVMPSEGGEARDLAKAKDFRSLAWTMDGKYVLYTKLREGGKEMYDLWRVPAAGGEPEKLDLGMRRLMHIKIHPDGRRIAFTASQKPSKSEVWIMENFLPAAPEASGTSTEKDSREFTMRRVYDEGLEWGNALSSDGRYLVYTDWATGDMAVVDVVTKDSRRLTNKNQPFSKSSEMGETSAFSPDDRLIAYGWHNKDKTPELRVLGFDGSNMRVLYRDERALWIRPHEWTPDGKFILSLVMGKDETSDIALISAADGNVRVLKKVQAKDPELDLSPDGRFILCSMSPDPKSAKRDIYIMKADGGGFGPLVEHASDDFSLGWAPDGRNVIFASDRTGAYGLWSIRVSEGLAEGHPALLRAGFNSANPVRLTPDGILYYVQGSMVSDVFTAAIDPDTGKVRGEPEAVKARFSGANAAPDWSRDGTRLAYRTNPGGMGVYSVPAMISVLDMRTGEERQVAPAIDSIDPNDGPRWAPDGRSVLVVGRRGEEKGVYRVDIASGAAIPLVITPRDQYILHAVWSPDGKSLFYPQGNPVRILRHDLGTGEVKELAQAPGPAGIPHVALSPDGKLLAFTAWFGEDERCNIVIVPSNGGAIRTIFRGEPWEMIPSLNWTADGGSLWFERSIPSKDPNVTRRHEFWRVSPDGENPGKLELAITGGKVRLHPDGSRIAFWNGRGRMDLWALENFLPAGKR